MTNYWSLILLILVHSVLAKNEVPEHVVNFEEYSKFSLANYEATVVFIGIFQDNKNEQIDLLVELTRQIAMDKYPPLTSDNVAIMFTDSDHYSDGDIEREVQNLSTLFENNNRGHVFYPRLVADIGTPQLSLKADRVDPQFVSQLVQALRDLHGIDPIDPLLPLDSPGQERYLIDYGMLDQAAIEKEWPMVTRPMCDGKPVCEIEKRSNLSGKEFYERYFLWGRPVIITDGMDGWNISSISSYEKIIALTETVEERRNETGKTQLINIVHEDDQNAVREHYTIPSFFDLPDPSRGNVSLDTELFFFGEKGAVGLDYHLDTGCHQYWVPHLKGSKKWTMKPIESREDAIANGRDPRWHFPQLEATLNPGDILIFYSGWWHQTEYPPNDETVSFTMYLQRPMPRYYLDEYRHELVTRGEYNRCLDRWFAPEAMAGRRLENQRKREQMAKEEQDRVAAENDNCVDGQESCSSGL